MRKKLKLNDLIDKKIIKLIKNFENSTEEVFCESEGYANIGEAIVKNKKNIAEHKLVLYLNKLPKLYRSILLLQKRKINK